MSAATWHRIESRYPRRHTVYWQIEPTAGVRITVARLYQTQDNAPRTDDDWRWAIRERDSDGRKQVTQEGRTSTSNRGRAEAWKAWVKS